MRIQEVQINRFKRFTDLRILDIPQTTRLVVLVGPNGSGKTSLFEAFNHWYKLSGFSSSGDQSYLEKEDGLPTTPLWFQDRVNITFHSAKKLSKDEVRGKFYFRSAYRNEPDFTVSSLQRQSDPRTSVRLSSLMINDQTVSENYQRLVAQTLYALYDNNNDAKSVAELREELIGRIRVSLGRVFDELTLSSIGDPIVNGGFYFDKGTSKAFHYKNLSAGEKAVFDLVLDMIIKSGYFGDAVFCIDEPEAHMHTRLQSKVLRELYTLTPSESQLWVATHSLGMLKEAEELERERPGTVAFLDFDNRDFDLTETMRPAVIDRAIWKRFYELALADFSSLVAPRRIVFCEGTSKGRKYKDFDAQVYTTIFGDHYHDTTFVSAGGDSEVVRAEGSPATMVSRILQASEIVKFVDRDDRSKAEIMELNSLGVRVSKRRHIESYLLDDEVITELCESVGKPELIDACITAKSRAINDSIQRNNPGDDIKSAAGTIYAALTEILGLTGHGNNVAAFLRDTMAPLITASTQVYQELEQEVFGTQT